MARVLADLSKQLPCIRVVLKHAQQHKALTSLPPVPGLRHHEMLCLLSYTFRAERDSTSLQERTPDDSVQLPLLPLTQPYDLGKLILTCVPWSPLPQSLPPALPPTHTQLRPLTKAPARELTNLRPNSLLAEYVPGS